MQAPTPQVLAAAATGIDRFIRRYKLCPDSFFGTLGFAPETASQPMSRMDLDLYCRMMELGAERSGDVNFGLAYGQAFTPEMLGLIGYIAINSPDLGTAAQNLATYFPWHQQGTVTGCRQQGGLTWMSYRIAPERVHLRDQDALVTLGMFSNVLRHAAGADWTPELIELEQPETGSRQEIEAAFGAPVRFGRPANALVFRSEDGVRAMPGADATLQQLLLCNLRALSLRENGPSLTEEVAEVIRLHLRDAELDLDRLSDRMGLPRWTLQRRLQECGTSFARLVEETRREQACRYLEGSRLSISHIAAELGYSEPSAFVRVFRRWENTSPSHYRKAFNALRH
ncbi:AraC family transcriptional regulator [Thioclava sp. GXIMD4215]|uniref:AraC-like transcriptional regulator QhpR n=1 Tax=Thioclava sp. GXIMD4215 TaxID=3131928 RepID=UPI00311AEAE3